MYKKSGSIKGVVAGSDDLILAEQKLKLLEDSLGHIKSRDDLVYPAIDMSRLLLKAPDASAHIVRELARKSDDVEVLSRYVIFRYKYESYPRARTLEEFPPLVQIEPTSICNFRCIFCYQI